MLTLVSLFVKSLCTRPEYSEKYLRKCRCNRPLGTYCVHPRWNYILRNSLRLWLSAIRNFCSWMYDVHFCSVSILWVCSLFHYTQKFCCWLSLHGFILLGTSRRWSIDFLTWIWTSKLCSELVIKTKSLIKRPLLLVAAFQMIIGQLHGSLWFPVVPRTNDLESVNG